MADLVAVHDFIMGCSIVVKLAIIAGFDCHVFSAVTLFCLAATWTIVGCKTLMLAGESVKWNLRLFSFWALSMAWHLSAHCRRLRSVTRTRRYDPQRADAYIMWILVLTMVEVVLHAGALHIHKVTAKNPVPFTLGDTLLLALPAVITGFALYCSMPRTVVRDVPPVIDTEL